MTITRAIPNELIIFPQRVWCGATSNLFYNKLFKNFVNRNESTKVSKKITYSIHDRSYHEKVKLCNEQGKELIVTCIINVQGSFNKGNKNSTSINIH